MDMTTSAGTHTAMTADVPAPMAVVYPSRSGGAPHVVTVLDLGDGALACTCPAMRSIAYRPSGCWAMKALRRLLGWPEPAGVTVEAQVSTEAHADIG